MDIYVILKTNILRPMEWHRLLWEAINLVKLDAVDNQLFTQELLFFL